MTGIQTINIGNITTDRGALPTAEGAIQWGKNSSVTENGTLVINQTQAGTLYGALSGSGTANYTFNVEKAGGGVLTLETSGFGIDYIREFFISDGSLNINRLSISSVVAPLANCDFLIGDNGNLTSGANGHALTNSRNFFAATGRFDTGNAQFTPGGYIVKPFSSATIGNISPTGIFGITGIDTANDGTLKINIDAINDKISVLTLKNDNGKIVFDLLGFEAIAEATPYTFLMWSNYVGSSVNLSNFGVSLPFGWGLDTSYGTSGFQIDNVDTYGKSLSFQLLQIPEPTAWALMGVSLLVVTLLRRKNVS